MLKTLRGRLILSHILPFIIIIPLIGIALVYFLETQFLLPQLSVDLGVDARLVAQMVRNQPELFQDPQLAQILLQNYSQTSDAQLMLLDASGNPLPYESSDNEPSIIQLLAPGEQQKIQTGQIVTHVDTKAFSPVSRIDVLAPVVDANRRTLGIVRLTYSFETVLERLLRLRTWIISIILLGLAVGVILGSVLAVTISRPIQQATSAVNRVALGHFDERLAVKEPQEIRQLAEAVNYLVSRLQNLEQARQKLLANLVHELGRPLGALHTAIQALSKGAVQDQQLTSDLLAGMDEETRRLQRLLDDLNGLYDQALGSLEIDRKPLNLNDWLPKLLSPWQEAAQAKGLTWENRFAPGLPVLQADPLRLGQAIGNLADNAIKFTPTGGRVIFSAQQTAEKVQIRIQDNGPGILPDEQEKIFHPFYQGDRGRRVKQGMGLGLSIARDLVTAHNGQLEVASQPGQGSEFTIHIPL
jgi:two-component system, OmpR family, sensor histidine kinase BaeS